MILAIRLPRERHKPLLVEAKHRFADHRFAAAKKVLQM
jgi:hypothetical protein